MHSDALTLRTQRGRRILVPIMLASMQNPLNSSLILTALVPIGNEFHAGPLQTGWLIAGLYLSSAVAQTPVGKFVDLLGARRTLVVGLVIVVLAACMGAFAPSLGWLIAARVLLGLGTSAGFPAAMAILRRVVGEGQAIPTGALSLLTIAGQVSTSVGPALSGLIVVLFGWRSTLSINIPMGIATLVMVLLWLPDDDKRPSDGLRGVLAQIDVPGIALFALSLTALMLGTDRVVPRALTLAAGVLFGIGFFARELTCERPFLDLRLIARSPGLGRTIVRQAVVMLVIYSVFYGTAEWLEDAHHASPQVVGLLMVPISIVAIWTAGTWARSRSPRFGLVAGSIGGGCACAILLFQHSTGPLLWVGVALGLSGLTNGFNAVANQSALYAQAPPGHIGVASGLFRSVQYVGAMLSAMLMGLAFGAHADDRGFHTTMIVAVVICAGLAVAAMVDRTIPERGAPTMR